MFERVIARTVRSALAFLIVIAASCPALASPPAGTCFAVRPLTEIDRTPSSVQCSGTPDGYGDAALWLRLPTPSRSPAQRPALVIHSTRFDRLKVLFAFADGSSETQEVRQGAFGSHWHVGGQIEFRPRAERAPLTAVWLRIERLQSYELLRIRFVPVDILSRQFELCAALIGAALGLLAVTALYNFALTGASRRRVFLWHGLWATMMVCWGLVWSQCALQFFPQIAGTLSSQLGTILACLAILFATLSAVDALKGVLSPRLRRALACAGLGVVVLGACADLPGIDLTAIGTGLAILTLSILAAVGSAFVIGYRRGNRDARDLLVAWTVPMLVLAATQVFDFSTSLLGGGAQIAVLFASAFQVICLSALATHRLGILRVERDAAIASKTALAELAERDALTGLLNRRGFVRRCEQAFDDLHHVPFGLLLIDVDQFKRINDQFGHESGDAVLVKLGSRLREFEQSHACLAGRLGGEEFVVGISGIRDQALWQFADQIREALGTRGNGFEPSNPELTVSVGVASGTGSGPFAALYGKADRAMYEAKASGRNRVVFFKAEPALNQSQQLERQ